MIYIQYFYFMYEIILMLFNFITFIFDISTVEWLVASILAVWSWNQRENERMFG